MAIRQSTRGASLSIADSSVMPRANGLASLVEGVILSWGWRRRSIAFVSGAIGALALPPFSAFPLIAAPLTIAVWLIDGAHDRGESRPLIGSLRAAFGAGWWMGFGYFLAGLWWVGSAFLVEADQIRLGAAARSGGAAGGPRLLSGGGICDRAALVVAGTVADFRARVRARSRRMGARPPLLRLSVERPRHGARGQSCPGADRLARRPARAHFPHDRDFRRAGDALASGREPPQSGADGRSPPWRSR